MLSSRCPFLCCNLWLSDPFRVVALLSSPPLISQPWERFELCWLLSEMLLHALKLHEGKSSATYLKFRQGETKGSRQMQLLFPSFVVFLPTLLLVKAVLCEQVCVLGSSCAPAARWQRGTSGFPWLHCWEITLFSFWSGGDGRRSLYLQ